MSDRATSVPRELSGDTTWWPFTDNERDIAAFTSRALDVHVDVADGHITLGGELDVASIDTLTDAVALLIEHNPGRAPSTFAGAAPERRLIFDIAGLFGIREIA